MLRMAKMSYGGLVLWTLSISIYFLGVLWLLKVDDWPSWIQTVGSVTGLFVAVALPYVDRNEQAITEAREQEVENYSLLEKVEEFSRQSLSIIEDSLRCLEAYPVRRDARTFKNALEDALVVLQAVDLLAISDFLVLQKFLGVRRSVNLAIGQLDELSGAEQAFDKMEKALALGDLERSAKFCRQCWQQIANRIYELR